MIRELNLVTLSDAMEFVPVGAAGESNTPRIPSDTLLLKYGNNNYTKGDKTLSFTFTEEDADAIIEDFKQRAKDVVVDYEHQTLSGQPAPASGWVNQLLKTPEGLKVLFRNWTDRARGYLQNKEYRYLSPVLDLHDMEGCSRPRALHSIALTNHPAIHGMKDLLAASDIAISGEDVDETIERFQSAIITLDKDISLERFSDDNDLERAKESRLAMLDDFSDYTYKNKSDNAKDIVTSFSEMLVCSDITDQAKQAYKNLKGVDAVQQLLALKESPGATKQELEYIDLLIKETQEDENAANAANAAIQPPAHQGVFSDNKKEKQGEVSMTEDEKKKLEAMADNKNPEDELFGEPPAEGEGDDTSITSPEETDTGSETETETDDTNDGEGAGTVEVDKAQLKEALDLLTTIAKAAGVDAEFSAENVEAFNDSKSKLIVALNDMALRPSKTEVEAVKKQVSDTEESVKKEKAESVVQAAMDDGKISEAFKGHYVREAMNDMPKFLEMYGPDSAAPALIPVKRTVAMSDHPDKKKPVKRQAFSDEQIEAARICGHAPEDVYPVEEN